MTDIRFKTDPRTAKDERRAYHTTDAEGFYLSTVYLNQAEYRAYPDASSLRRIMPRQRSGPPPMEAAEYEHFRQKEMKRQQRHPKHPEPEKKPPTAADLPYSVDELTAFIEAYRIKKKQNDPKPVDDWLEKHPPRIKP